MKLLFDNGTLVLDEVPPNCDLASLPAVRWDERVGLWRAPGYTYAELCRALAATGLPVSNKVRRTRAVPGTWRPIELRGYQEAAYDAWELSGRRGVVLLPTGSGKTRTAMACMARSGLSTLVVVPTRALLHQWCQALAKSYEGRVGVYGDGQRMLAPLTVSTFESAYRHMERIGNCFGLLVIDEAHHFGHGLRDELLEMAIAPARLGLTATPPRDESASQSLERLIGPDVYELGIGDLTGTFLASFDLVTLELGLDPDERRVYEGEWERFRSAHQAFLRLAPEASWADFVRHCARSSAGRRAMQSWHRARRLLAFTRAKRAAIARLVNRHRSRRLLVFTPDNPTAYAIAREHLIMPLTCDVGRSEREQALDMFRSGRLNALVSSRVLNEGLDVPDADIAIIVGGTLGEREHVQRIGRLLRPAPRKRALIYELVTRATQEIRQARRRRAGLGSRTSTPC